MHKPYRSHSDCDVFYLDISRNVFEILDKNTDRFWESWARPERKFLMELAYTATAYFEDRVSGPAIFAASSTSWQKQEKHPGNPQQRFLLPRRNRTKKRPGKSRSRTRTSPRI